MLGDSAADTTSRFTTISMAVTINKMKCYDTQLVGQ